MQLQAFSVISIFAVVATCFVPGFSLELSAIGPLSMGNRTEITAKINIPFVLVCPLSVEPQNSIMWITNRKSIIVGNITKSKDHNVTFDALKLGHISVLDDGSLVIRKVGRGDAGLFVCIYDNATSSFVVTLDYKIVSEVTVYSILAGFVSATAFLLIAIVLGAIRYFNFICSKEERAKRRSIREVLTVIRSSSHMERLNAYKMAKMDKLSSFKSATMDQLVAFKTSKVDKLRTYKQATVLGLQQYLDRMREYYSAQTDRLKRNCADRTERLRQNYTAQRSRMEGRRSAQVKRIRDNYHARRTRIRDYSSAQMNKLRDQYKLQQQHVLKLLELLEIGNCVNLIRDDCERTESAIFDADAPFTYPSNYMRSAHQPGSGQLEGSDDDDDDNIEDEDILNAGSPDFVSVDDDRLTPMMSLDDDVDVEDEEEQVEEGGYNVTMDDVLGDIVAHVDLIRSMSASGEHMPSSSATNFSPNSPRVLNHTVSLRDLHHSVDSTPFQSPDSCMGDTFHRQKDHSTADDVFKLQNESSGRNIARGSRHSLNVAEKMNVGDLAESKLCQVYGPSTSEKLEERNNSVRKESTKKGGAGESDDLLLHKCESHDTLYGTHGGKNSAKKSNSISNVTVL